MIPSSLLAPVPYLSSSPNLITRVQLTYVRAHHRSRTTEKRHFCCVSVSNLQTNTLHKDRVRGVRDGAGKVRWEKLFKGWTALNEIWRGAVGRRMGRQTTRGTHMRVS